MNGAIVDAARRGVGIGQGVGEMLLAHAFPYNGSSLLATAARLNIPVTVHVAVGTDIIHIHPGADGAAIGQASLHDFRLFCRLASGLEGGAYLNFGSAVLLPEVFLKALTVVAMPCPRIVEVEGGVTIRPRRVSTIHQLKYLR